MSKMSKKLSFEDACFQWASGFYLTDNLPDDFFIHDPETCDLEDWEEYKDDLLENNLWEPFEFYDAGMISKSLCNISHISNRVNLSFGSFLDSLSTKHL